MSYLLSLFAWLWLFCNDLTSRPNYSTFWPQSSLRGKFSGSLHQCLLFVHECLLSGPHLVQIKVRLGGARENCGEKVVKSKVYWYRSTFRRAKRQLAHITLWLRVMMMMSILVIMKIEDISRKRINIGKGTTDHRQGWILLPKIAVCQTKAVTAGFCITKAMYIPLAALWGKPPGLG